MGPIYCSAASARSPAGAEATPLGDIGAEDVDTAGPYGWQDSTRGQRRAQQQLDAQQVAAQTIEGQGTWRQLAPGTRFALRQHAGVAADAAFLCLQVRHQARNNLGAEVFDALEQALGAVTVAGTLSAIVVSDGGPVQSDRDHRIKV